MERIKKEKSYETYEWRQKDYLIQAEFEDGKFRNLNIGKDEIGCFKHLITFLDGDREFMEFIKETLADLETLLK